MNRFEILQIIKTLSKRRHRSTVKLSKLLQYPNIYAKEIDKERVAIRNFDIDIDNFMSKLTNL